MLNIAVYYEMRDSLAKAEEWAEKALTPGLDFSAYPRAYSISFGINLGF